MTPCAFARAPGIQSVPFTAPMSPMDGFQGVSSDLRASDEVTGVSPEHLHGVISCSAGLPVSAKASGPKQMRHSGSSASSSTCASATLAGGVLDAAGTRSSAMLAGGLR